MAAVATAALVAGARQRPQARRPSPRRWPRWQDRGRRRGGFWAASPGGLGGTKVTEASIISNLNTDPHDYEPTAADARTISMAKLVVVNGIGYDPWASKLLAATPVDGRQTLNVGDLSG
jgi:hypothetical protein